MSGFVSLVGAGPGNPELLTVLAKRRLAEADVVIYDRLVNPALLVPLTAKKIDVGKLPQHHKVSQYQINQLLVETARKVNRVVRLKSGDPYVFGRGGEESQYLRAHHVDFEVVPGITSAIAGLGAAGIPITHRDFASSFHVITGHHQINGSQPDWENIAHQEGTLVFLMGMAELGQIAGQLIKHGRPKTTPVAVIQWATHWNQRAVRADLATIEAEVKAYRLGAPALIVVGNVVRLMSELASNRPLQGLHLLVPFSPASKLFTGLQDYGAAVNFFNRQKKQPLDFDLSIADDVDTLVVSDVSAFDFFEQKLLATGYDHRWLADRRVLATNQAIADYLRSRGIIIDGDFNPAGSHFLSRAVVIGEQQALAQLKLTGIQKLATWRAIPTVQNIDFSQFHGIVFPSSASAMDLLAGCTVSQKQQLAELPCFAMGQRVGDKSRQLGFQQITTVSPSIEAVITAVIDYFKNEVDVSARLNY